MTLSTWVGDEPGREESIDAILQEFPPFTNRWAAWCWRIHQAAPDLNDFDAFVFADFYSREELAYDLLPHNPPMNVEGYDGYLVFRPDRLEKNGDQEGLSRYLEAIRLGVFPPLPDQEDYRQRERLLSRPPPSWRRGIFYRTDGSQLQVHRK